MAKVLIVGGAGYIGSSVNAWLIDHGHQTWVLDDLSTGHQELVLSDGFTLGRCGDKKVVGPLLEKEQFDCVMHFSAFSLVGESVENPKKYHENNVLQTKSLLELMVDYDVKKFVFSSTCAIFGDPGDQCIDENLEQKPINPYGETKLEVEQMLDKFSKEKGFQAVALRYFNACGAEPKLRVGEWHENETHLIPRILQAACNDKPIQIYGTDYPTFDGTCVRDYIHVWDLAFAHAAAMDKLLNNESDKGVFYKYNLGSENGFSVRQIIEATEKVLGKSLTVNKSDRRPGDPPRLVADSMLAKKELDFIPKFSNVDDIIHSAWKWEQKRLELQKNRS